MKNNYEIILRLGDKLNELETKQKEHEDLGQIDMLSGSGSKLREEINILKGEIKALNWILK